MITHSGRNHYWIGDNGYFVYSSTGYVARDEDDTGDLGTGTKRWDDVYATNGTIQTSDQTKKDNIQNSTLGLNFVDQLQPRQFKFKDYTTPTTYYEEGGVPCPVGKNIGDVRDESYTKTHTRTHYGLIAQEVEQVLTDNGLTTTDFAPLIKSPVLDKDGNETGNHNYGMRYTELIGVLIKAIQELSAKVKVLEG